MRPTPYLFAGLIVCAVAARAIAAAPAGPRERGWFEQVERDRDRGAGRVVDDATWEAQRLQDQRDLRLGRVQPRRAFDQFDEQRDREVQVERSARRQERGHTRGLGETDPQRSAILCRPPTSGHGAGLPTLAAVVAREQRELAEAKETLGRSLKAVDAAEGRELRLLRRRLNREGKSDQFEVDRQPIQQQFDALRSRHRQTFDRVRSRIMGKPLDSSKGITR